MFKKEVSIVSQNIKNMEETNKFGSYLGKRVYSKSGEYVGKLKEFVAHNNDFAGMLIYGKSNLYIDKEFFSLNSEDSIVLSIDPITILLGKVVFDADGRNLGKVIGIDRNSNLNNFKHLLVRKGSFSKPAKVSKTEISVMKKNIILKTSYK
ncbi:MAG: hypothetical protein PF569_10240 [Candidatus Woesearchaeota archaeon]|nr:hypothetical protein [Candidatus Woesearchaeota archaeon]